MLLSTLHIFPIRCPQYITVYLEGIMQSFAYITFIA